MSDEVQQQVVKGACAVVWQCRNMLARILRPIKVSEAHSLGAGGGSMGLDSRVSGRSSMVLFKKQDQPFAGRLYIIVLVR